MTEKKLSSRDILLQTGTLEAAAVFYEGALGLTRFMTEPNMIGLEAGAFRLFLERAPGLGPVFEFFVDDLAAAKQRLVEQGCSIVVEDPSVPKCYVRDPFGLIFNLAQR